MGFIKRATEGKGITAEDPEEESSSRGDGVSKKEENYMKMYMKIGRDFVHKEDFNRIIEQILDHLDIDDFEIDLDRGDAAAMQRAEEYKYFLDTNQSGSKHYPDLIDLNKE
mgnify:CR=1 FL=1